MKKFEQKRSFTSKSKRADLEKQTLKNFKASELKKLTGLKGTKKEIVSKVNKQFLYNSLNKKFPSKFNNQYTIISNESGIDRKIELIEKYNDPQLKKLLKGAKSVRIIFERGYSSSTRTKLKKEGKEVPKYFHDFGGSTPNDKVKTVKDLMEFVADTLDTLKQKVAKNYDDEPHNVRKIFLKFMYQKDEKK